MARPKDKQALIEASEVNFAKLWQLIEKLTEKEFNTPFDFSDNPKLKEVHWQRDKNVRDILIHLYEWHQLLIRWITQNQSNQSSEPIGFLPEPYTWENYAEMNVAFWQKHQQTPYEKSVTMLKNSHHQVMKIVDTLSDDELFTKQYFPWTGTTNVGSYCISATSSHYDWALKKLKKHKKNLKK